MLVNKQNLAAIFVGLKAHFMKGLGSAESQWQKVAMLVPSTTKSNDYSWLSKMPKMRKWIGEKVVKSLAAFKYSIENDDFEVTVEVDRNDINDDNLGIYGPQAKSAGESAKQLPDEMVFSLIAAGFNTKCFDGQYFFDTDHPVGDPNNPTSVSNKGTKKLSIASQAAAKASFGDARAAMRSFKDDEGRPLGIKPNILLVGPALEDTAEALMNNERLEDGKVNLYRKRCEVVVADWIEGEQWFLLDTRKSIMPIIYQERQKPEFVEQTDPQSDDVFNRKKYKFGAEARAAVGFGFWQLAWGSDGTVA